MAKKVYRGDREGILDRLRLALASARSRAVESNEALLEAGGFSRLLKFAENWKAPEFPLKGGDVLKLGATAGPNVGQLLKGLEDEWADSGFTLDRGALLERAAQRLKS